MCNISSNHRNNFKTILLIISLITNIAFMSYISFLNNRMPKSIIGTYCSDQQINPERMYFTFEEDGNYSIYKQGSIIETGTYHAEDISSNILIRSKDNAKQWVIYDNKDTIYYNNLSNNTIRFDRISDIPAYINVKNPF